MTLRPRQIGRWPFRLLGVPILRRLFPFETASRELLRTAFLRPRAALARFQQLPAPFGGSSRFGRLPGRLPGPISPDSAPEIRGIFL